ncbi:hypothetical protein V6N13_024541 [Hibiscus sabdariffa]
MDVTDAIPIHVAMPTPGQSEHTEPPTPATNLEDPAGLEPTTPPASHQGSPLATSAVQGSFVAAPIPTAPTTDPQPSPAHSAEAPSLYILQLHSQLQRIEAWQIEFITESKVFQTTLLQFLYDNFSAKSAEFPPAPPAPSTSPAVANSVATRSARAGEMEKVQYSSNAKPDAFDWNTPHNPPPSAPSPPAEVAESSMAQK